MFIPEGWAALAPVREAAAKVTSLTLMLRPT